jgi:hypothetical protein
MSDAQSTSKLNSSALTLGFCVFLAIAAFFLRTEHRAHLFGILPYLILLACPFIHLFMHRGHRSHGHGDHGPGRHGGKRNTGTIPREAGDDHRQRDAS